MQLLPRLFHRSPLHRASRALALATALICAAAQVSAQLFEDPDWREAEAPPPPALKLDGLVPVEMPAYSRLTVGVDPESLKIGGDGVVRYVIVASSPRGAVNAFYEGVRCATGEMKVYARHSSGAWQPVSAPEWTRIATSSARHTMELAKALCLGRAPRNWPGDIVRELRNPVRN